MSNEIPQEWVEKATWALRDSRLSWGTHPDRWVDPAWQAEFWCEAATTVLEAVLPDIATQRGEAQARAYQMGYAQAQADVRRAVIEELEALPRRYTRELSPSSPNLSYDEGFDDGVEHAARVVRGSASETPKPPETEG